MSMDEKIKALRDATLGKAGGFRTEIVEIEGVKFKVIQPSIRQRDVLLSSSMHSDKDGIQLRNSAKLFALACIECVRHPETNEKVFMPHDMDALMDAPSGSFVDELGSVVMRLMNVEPNKSNGAAEAKT